MAARPEEFPLIVILGQTASGKSELAMAMAKRFNGEIISADSRAIYKGMDIGTAKPSLSAQREVKHHLIDIIDPDQPFNVSEYKKRAVSAISQIQQKNKVSFMVGGTGLYIDSVIFDYSFRSRASDEQRAELETESVGELQKRILQLGLSLPNNPNNPRHLIRVIETKGQPSRHSLIRPNTLIIGIKLSPDMLQNRISERMHQMIESGLIEEINRLVGQYGWDYPSMQIPSYQSLRGYIDNKNMTINQSIELSVQKEMQFAKRQATWFKRNKYIHWINQQIEAVDIITTFLSK